MQYLIILQVGTPAIYWDIYIAIYAEVYETIETNFKQYIVYGVVWNYGVKLEK